MLGEQKGLNPFKINIQLFAEGDEPNYQTAQENVLDMLQAEGGDEPPVEPVVEEPIQEPMQGTEPVVEEPQQTMEPPVQELPPQPSQNELMLMQQLQQMQQAMAQQQQQFQQFIQNQMMQQQPQQPPQPQKTPEEIQAENQALVDELLQNPMEVLNRVVQQAVNPLQKEIQSYKEKEEWDIAKRHFGQMAGQDGNPLHPAYAELQDRIDQILKERPGIANPQEKLWALKNAYDIALAEKYASQPPQPVNFMDMAKDPNNLKQLLSDPNFMKMVTAAQAQMQKQAQQQVPPMAPSSGMSNAAPYIKTQPKNPMEARQEALAILNQNPGL